MTCEEKVPHSDLAINWNVLTCLHSYEKILIRTLASQNLTSNKTRSLELNIKFYHPVKFVSKFCILRTILTILSCMWHFIFIKLFNLCLVLLHFSWRGTGKKIAGFLTCVLFVVAFISLYSRCVTKLDQHFLTWLAANEQLLNILPPFFFVRSVHEGNFVKNLLVSSEATQRLFTNLDETLNYG